MPFIDVPGIMTDQSRRSTRQSIQSFITGAW